MAEVAVGSTVKLKSGGPVMTVDQIGKRAMQGSGPDHAWCQWFEKTKLMNGVFPVTSLEVVS